MLGTKARTPLTLGTQSKMAIQACKFDSDGLHVARPALCRELAQVCEGVDFLHGHSPPVVHRDLKSCRTELAESNKAKGC